METLTLDVTLREKTGKGVARKLRIAEKLPAVLNSAGNTVPLELEKKPMLKLINSQKSGHTLLTLNVSNASSDNKSRTAIVKDFQVHPITNELIHIDFKEIKMDEKISITVPVILKGVAKGVKEGGVMQVMTRNVTVECMPGNIVDSVEFDITNVKANSTVHASSLILPEGVVLKSSPEAVILVISTPRASDAVSEEKTAVEETPAPEKSEE